MNKEELNIRRLVGVKIAEHIKKFKDELVDIWVEIEKIKEDIEEIGKRLKK